MYRDAGLAALVLGAFAVMILGLVLQEMIANPIMLGAVILSIMTFLLWRRSITKERENLVKPPRCRRRSEEEDRNKP